ncbi:MAG: FHA domain-containing protein [Variovorax sp.]
MPRLIIQAEHGSVRQISITGPTTSIGRAATNRVRIDSDKVSRQHAVIQWSGDRYVLTDAGSRNGTYVNDRQVVEHALSNGDAIVLGDCSLRFLYSIEVVPQAQAMRLLTMPTCCNSMRRAPAPPVGEPGRRALRARCQTRAAVSPDVHRLSCAACRHLKHRPTTQAPRSTLPC